MGLRDLNHTAFHRGDGLIPMQQRRRWQRQGGEASWWPPGSVSQTGPPFSVLYTLDTPPRHLHMRKTDKSVSRISFLLSSRSWFKCGAGARIYESHILWISILGLFQFPSWVSFNEVQRLYKSTTTATMVGGPKECFWRTRLIWIWGQSWNHLLVL